MNKNKNLSKGMTLVEVIIAMTIFAVMSATIMTVLLASYKQIDRSKRRDVEGANQVATVNKKDNVTKISTGASDYKIVYTPTTGSTKTLNNVKLFQANEDRYGADFGFHVKSLSTNAATTVSTPTPAVTDPNFAKNYKIQFTNNSSSNVTMYVEITDGYIYQGNPDSGYIHTSKVYTRTALANSGSGIFNVVDFGYINDSFASGNLKIRFVSDTGSTYGTITLGPSSFSTSSHIKTFSYDGTTWS